MRLLVFDVEGTIFKPCSISDDSPHASYIWTRIAKEIGAEAEELKTQREWEKGHYGSRESGASYFDWVKETISIHKSKGLMRETFDRIVDEAEYVDGVEKFFEQLNRELYIPILISGGIQNLSIRACKDLNIQKENSYAACEYFFNNEKIDEKLTFINTCNFFGKQEIVKIALRKYGIGSDKWIFIGDGVNDVSIARQAPLSIGVGAISKSLKEVVDFSFKDYYELLDNSALLEREGLVVSNGRSGRSKVSSDDFLPIIDTKQIFWDYSAKLKAEANTNVRIQMGNLHIDKLEKKAYERVNNISKGKRGYITGKIRGVIPLLEFGEYTFSLLAMSGEKMTTSATLQPFCNASEIMIYVCYCLIADEGSLEHFIDTENGDKTKKLGIYDLIETLGNVALEAVLKEYRYNRNLAAHSYQEIPIEAARTFIQRTYEGIQRMELIING